MKSQLKKKKKMGPSGVSGASEHFRVCVCVGWGVVVVDNKEKKSKCILEKKRCIRASLQFRSGVEGIIFI